MPTLFAALAQALAEVGTASAQGDLVGRTAVLGLIDNEAAFVDQRRPGPADREGQRDAPARDLKRAIAVVERDVELVGLVAAAFGERETDQARVDHRRDVSLAELQAIHGPRMKRGAVVVAHPGTSLSDRTSCACSMASTRSSSTRASSSWNSIRREYPSR